jgi:RND family efflux transporter MFP subunit
MRFLGMKHIRLMALLLSLLVGCSGKEGAVPSQLVERFPRLEVVEPMVSDIPIRIDLTATVEAFEKADLCARVPGVVAEMPADVDIGRRVKAGEVLVKLAVPDLEADKASKEAQFEQAQKQKQQVQTQQVVAGKELEESRELERRYQAEHTFRKDQYDRRAELVKKGTLQPELLQESLSQLQAAEAAWRAARVQIETRQARLQALQADLEVAESRIKVARAEADRLGVLVGYAALRAPFDGSITRRWVDRGAMIKDAGAPLLTIMNTDVVRVVLDVPARDAPLINATEQDPNPNGVGDPVTLRLPALRGNGRNVEHHGHITRRADALDPVTRTMRVEVHLQNRNGELRPGMFGTATVQLDEGYNRVVIPATALVRRGDNVEVFHVTDVTGNPPRGVIRAASVELGLDNGRWAEVRGLPEKAKVIAKASSVIREGDTIIPVPLRER